MIYTVYSTQDEYVRRTGISIITVHLCDTDYYTSTVLYLLLMYLRVQYVYVMRVFIYCRASRGTRLDTNVAFPSLGAYSSNSLSTDAGAAYRAHHLASQ